MFKVTFFVEDSKLGEAFKRLAGLGRNVEHAYVPNVEPAPHANGKVKVNAADAIELLTKELRKRRIETFQGPNLKVLLADLGMATSSYSHHLEKLVAAGVLKKGKIDKTTQGRSMSYHVVK